MSSLTQYLSISIKAKARHTAAAIKGLTLVFVAATSPSPITPENIATMLFSVVITPNMESKLISLLSKPCAKYSVTIHDSKVLNISVVLSPPNSLPAKRTIRSFEIFVKQPTAYVTQNTRQANRRPYRSAKEPTKSADTAAAKNPQVNKLATTVSERFFSSLYNV